MKRALLLFYENFVGGHAWCVVELETISKTSGMVLSAWEVPPEVIALPVAVLREMAKCGTLEKAEMV